MFGDGGNDAGADQIIEDLAQRCWNWVANTESVERENIPSQWEEGEFKLNKTDSMEVGDQRCEDGRFWRMTRREWGREEMEKWFVNYIFIAMDGDRIEFSLLQDIVDQEERVGPPIVDVYPPTIVGEIIGQYKCQFQSDSLTSEWDYIPSTEASRFVEEQIISPTRSLPIVLLSKDDSGETIIEDIGTLAEALSGICRVYILGGTRTGRNHSLFGKQQLYDGTIRIFWPGRTREMLAYPAWDDMYSRRKLEEIFDRDEGRLIQALVNKICNATSSVPASSILVKSVRERIAEEEGSLQLEEMEEARSKALNKIERSEEKIEFLTGQIRTLSNEDGRKKLEILQKENDIREMQGRVDSLRHQIQRVGDELSGYKKLKMLASQAQKRDRGGDVQADIEEYILGWGKADSPEPEPEKKFKTLAEAIVAAKAEFPRLTFLKTAIDSAERTGSDADPDNVYDIFKWLSGHENSGLWKTIKDEMGIDKARRRKRSRNYIHQAMKARMGGKYAREESGLTMEKFGSQKNPNGRLFKLKENVLIRLQPHIKLGSSVKLRIHLICLDEESYVEIIESFVKENGDVVYKKAKKKRAKEVISDFPAIIIGWCGDHLENARNNG